MEYVIGLDLSMSSTGVAIFSQDGEIQKLISIETDSKSETQIRLKKIGRELIKIRNTYKPKIIVIEKGFYRFNISTEQIFRVHGLVNYIFWDIPQEYIHATTIRKIVVGKGNSKKEEVRDFILNKYKNIIFENMDESDAFACGLCYFEKLKMENYK